MDDRDQSAANPQSLKPITNSQRPDAEGKDFAELRFGEAANANPHQYYRWLKSTKLGTLGVLLGGLVSGATAIKSCLTQTEKGAAVMPQPSTAAEPKKTASSANTRSTEGEGADPAQGAVLQQSGTALSLQFDRRRRECHGDFDSECAEELSTNPSVKVLVRDGDGAPYAMSCVLFDPPIDIAGFVAAEVTYQLEKEDHVAFKFEGTRKGRPKAAWVRHFDGAPLPAAEKASRAWPLPPEIDKAEKFCFEVHGPGPIPNRLTILGVSLGH